MEETFRLELEEAREDEVDIFWKPDAEEPFGREEEEEEEGCRCLNLLRTRLRCWSTKQKKRNTNTCCIFVVFFYQMQKCENDLHNKFTSCVCVRSFMPIRVLDTQNHSNESMQ